MNLYDEWNKEFPSDTKKSKGKGKPIEYIQKISNILGYPNYKLVESVLVKGVPKFLISDGSNIKIQSSIELEDRTLKPFAPNSYMNKPYSFDSDEQVQEYVAKARSERFDTLYRRVKPIWKRYIDADDFHITMCAADTIFTYFQDRIGLTHYLFFVGPPGSGKSNNLTLFQYLAYRNMTSTGLSYANIYQFLGSGEEGTGTICEDEADNIDEDPEKMKIYKNGYTTGRPTAKTDISYGRNQLKFNNYCWKALSAEKLPDVVKGQGFNQRIIEILCTYGIPQYDISEVVNPAGEQEFQGLLNELLEVRNLLLIYRLLHYSEPLPNIKLNLVNREKQLFKPVIRVFQKTETLKELLPVISKYVRERREKNANTFHAFLYKLIKGLIEKNNSYELASSEIWLQVILDLEGQPIQNKPLSIDTADFGTLSQKYVIQILKEVFGATKPSHHGSSSKLVFDPSKLAKLGKIYDIKLEVEVKESGDDGEDGDGSGKVGLDKHMQIEHKNEAK